MVWRVTCNQSKVRWVLGAELPLLCWGSCLELLIAPAFPPADIVHVTGSQGRIFNLPIVSHSDWGRKLCDLCLSFRDLKIGKHSNIRRFCGSTVKSSLPHTLLHAAMNLCRSKGVALVCRFIKYIDICVYDTNILCHQCLHKCTVHTFESFSGKLTEESKIVVLAVFGVK